MQRNAAQGGCEAFGKLRSGRNCGRETFQLGRCLQRNSADRLRSPVLSLTAWMTDVEYICHICTLGKNNPRAGSGLAEGGGVTARRGLTIHQPCQSLTPKCIFLATRKRPALSLSHAGVCLLSWAQVGPQRQSCVWSGHHLQEHQLSREEQNRAALRNHHKT